MTLTQRLAKFWTILDARNKEFLRDRSALGWNIIFPVLVVFGFAFAFRNDNQEIFKVALVGAGAPAAATLAGGEAAPADPSLPEFTRTRHVRFVTEPELEPAIAKLRRHSYDMVFMPGDPQKYWINSSSPKGYLLEKILMGSDAGGARLEKQTVEGREIRYVDWLISGLLGMNMMFSALFGVGYVIVRYRKNGVLKRLKATPITAFEFLSAQILSRLTLITFITAIVYAGCHFFIRFQMLGSYFTLALVLVLGAMCLISLALLVAARVKSEEFAGGLLNLISWPMMFLSGVWFSLEGAHPLVKKLALAFPLTHVIDAARAVMTEGAGFTEIAGHVGVLAAMTAVFLAIGSATFRWE